MKELVLSNAKHAVRETQFDKMEETIYIIDTCVFVKEGFFFDNGRIHISPYSVIEEVKSPEASIRLDCIERQRSVEFMQPKKEFIEEAKNLEKKIKAKGKLSRTDLDIIALALFFVKRGKKVRVVTDDFLIQKICKKNNIDYDSFFLFKKI